MDHRLCAVLAITCFSLAGTGCSWKWQRTGGEQIVMPLQTGSTLQRRVMVPAGPEDAAAKPETPKKKKEPKSTAAKPSEPEKPPHPKKPAQSKKSPEPEDEKPAAPDRFR